jgi:hypothetical protein
MENKFRGTNERGGGILQRGVHRKTRTYAKNIYRPTEPIRSHSHDEIWIWSKKDLAVVLISSPHLALAHHLLCLRISVSPSSTAPAPAPGKRLHHRLREFHLNPHSFPHQQIRPICGLSRRPRATSGGNSCQSRKFFFALLLSLPPPPFPF